MSRPERLEIHGEVITTGIVHGHHRVEEPCVVFSLHADGRNIAHVAVPVSCGEHEVCEGYRRIEAGRDQVFDVLREHPGFSIEDVQHLMRARQHARAHGHAH